MQVGDLPLPLTIKKIEGVVTEHGLEEDSKTVKKTKKLKSEDPAVVEAKQPKQKHVARVKEVK